MAADRGRPVLSVEGLETCFDTDQGILKAVDGVTFAVAEAETVGVVGESGCGKSVTALSIMNLLPRKRGRIAAGSIAYRQTDGARIDLAALEPDSREMRGIRGHEIAMIFQEPMTSLNPVYTIGAQIVEAIRHHELVGKQEARRRAIELIARVGIAAPAQRVDEYPFQLSGGMRQRVMIAMALSCNPRVLIADEPTTALDVTVEAQILRLLQDLQREYRMSLMIITHDLGVIGELADRVLVMYMGRIVEQAPVDDLFYATRHPYTRALLRSLPAIGRSRRLTPIGGSVPNPYLLPAGCAFAPRCPDVMAACDDAMPELVELADDHSARCFLYD